MCPPTIPRDSTATIKYKLRRRQKNSPSYAHLKDQKLDGEEARKKNAKQ